MICANNCIINIFKLKIIFIRYNLLIAAIIIIILYLLLVVDAF